MGIIPPCRIVVWGLGEKIYVKYLVYRVCVRYIYKILFCFAFLFVRCGEGIIACWCNYPREVILSWEREMITFWNGVSSVTQVRRVPEAVGEQGVLVNSPRTDLSFPIVLTAWGPAHCLLNEWFQSQEGRPVHKGLDVPICL